VADIELSFPERDIASAIVEVKHLVKRGLLPPPPTLELLLLEDDYEAWRLHAVRWLDARGYARQNGGVIAEKSWTEPQLLQ